jgi:hypothetical protein
MNPIKEFAAFHGNISSASTRRVYVSAAKKEVNIQGSTPDNCGSYEELLSSWREKLLRKKIPKALRIAPFLGFLKSKTSEISVERPDYEPIRICMVDRIGKQTKAVREE